VKLRLLGLATLVLAGTLAVATPAGSANECDGLQVCIPIAGPWVVVPTGNGPRRPKVEWQITCPRGHVAGGLDAELSHRAIDVNFLGTLGSPVNPGVSTGRSVVFVGSWVGVSPRGPTFKPYVGCMPASGGGSRVPTSVAQPFPPGQPTARRVKTVRVRPGTTTITQSCRRGEHLVGASHAFGFDTRTPPSASLVSTVRGGLSIRVGRVVVRVRGHAELGGVRARVQVHAVCSSER
jgi:hypothetical protein